MTPTHTNKRGARYRYYVSHAMLQKRSDEAGAVTRISAPDIERMVIAALRDRPREDDGKPPLSDRDLIEQYVERVVIHKDAVEIQLRSTHDGEETSPAPDNCSSEVITLPWTVPALENAKGILHAPSPSRAMDPVNRDALLTAIAKARGWIEDLVKGRVATLAEVAERGGKVERHVRFLAPLAFVSPRIIAAIIDGFAPTDLTVTALATSLPYAWSEQEQRLG